MITNNSTSILVSLRKGIYYVVKAGSNPPPSYWFYRLVALYGILTIFIAIAFRILSLIQFSHSSLLVLRIRNDFLYFTFCIHYKTVFMCVE